MPRLPTVSSRHRALASSLAATRLPGEPAPGTCLTPQPARPRKEAHLQPVPCTRSSVIFLNTARQPVCDLSQWLPHPGLLGLGHSVTQNPPLCTEGTLSTCLSMAKTWGAAPLALCDLWPRLWSPAAQAHVPVRWRGVGDCVMRHEGCPAHGWCSGMPALCFVPFSLFFPLPWDPGPLAAGPRVDVPHTLVAP